MIEKDKILIFSILDDPFVSFFFPVAIMVYDSGGVVSLQVFKKDNRIVGQPSRKYNPCNKDAIEDLCRECNISITDFTEKYEEYWKRKEDKFLDSIRKILKDDKNE